MQLATINVAGVLKYTVNLTPFSVQDPAQNPDTLYRPSDADDIIFGGLGNDALHGGAGDDAISGAEALPAYYSVPFNPRDYLRWGETSRAGEFAAYDEYHPMTKLYVHQLDRTYANSTDADAIEFILNFLDSEDDGKDVLFGDLGNDWLVGGRDQDHLSGGWGDDLLNADDLLNTSGGLNTSPDTDPSYEDIAYGGAGRDVLIGNTGGDRLID